MSRIQSLLLVAFVAILLPGCSMMEWVRPHQLWKINREPALGGEDGYFSVPAQPVPSSDPWCHAEQSQSSD